MLGRAGQRLLLAAQSLQSLDEFLIAGLLNPKRTKCYSSTSSSHCFWSGGLSLTIKS